MSRLWNYLVFQAWMSYLMAAGLLVFTSGFLLNRVARPERAECARCTPEAGCDAAGLLQDTGYAAGVCLERKARVVLLIVDALKYEFAEWYDDDASMSSYHRNKLPVIRELLQKQPSHSRLYKFVADPPTTTMQRLKGLTTGSLPTFIEVGSNFASGYINEDNMIEQNAAGGIVFMGDDTWTNLFPGKFMRQFPSPSFNVWDLDSVDKNVQYRIFFEMKKKDWSLLIAHTLGVDHCGHKHGTQHPEMSRKLKDANKLITEIVESLENDMMLFVVGDHGMTETGDHGGDSPSEIEAAMFVYSTTPLLKGFAINGSNSVNQVDLVPTLSSILGTPIPFSNLGSVVLDCLPSQPAETTAGRLLHPLQSLWRNIAQTKRYIEIYSADANLFSKEQLQDLDHVYGLLSERVRQVDSPEKLEAFVRDTRGYFKLLKDTCSEVWVQFDSGLISKGLLLMFCSLFFFYLFITGIPESRMCDIFKSSFLQCAVIANLITVAITTCLFLLDVLEELRNMTFFATGAVSIGFLVLVIAQNWDVISMCWYEHRRIKLLTYVSRIILLLTVCGLFSNSYIVEEDKVLSFLFITLLCLLVFDLRRSDSDGCAERKTTRFVGSRPSRPNFRTIVLIVGLVACVSIRLSHYFWRCREEHLNRACSVSATGKVDWSTVSNNWERVLPAVVILALYVTVVKLWLRDRGNLTGFAPSVMVGQYCSVLIGVCISCYWVLQKLPKFYKVKFVLSWQVKTLPNVVYLLCVLAILVLYYRPLSIYMLPKKRESIEVYREENLVPRLFERIKDSISRKRIDTDDTPVICGIGTTYSAAFISLSVFLTLLYSLLLGDSLSPSTFLIFVTCAAVLGLSTIERYKNANTISELLDVSMPVLLCWFLSAEYFFYGTGHQATFPTIHWHAAFVGTGGHFYGHLMSAILIGINTFGSHIILGATLPLLVIVPFTLHLVFPKFLKAKFLEDDMKRGELLFLLSEQDSAFQAAVFSVAGKYVLLHGIRTFGSMLAATIHCRHLMVWKIFAPKLIFEGLGFLVTLCSVLASFYLVFRIEQQMEYVITRITKGR
ncbi:PREDICTED: GPI ethanolamine phosphate transferase 3 [Dinoponera quadriceps]|uniref:GPI ethanolamine phosphate transferase 3 n=1 Tax=Dinoponera quadriceps TaxID=609295 RepID=A0A6P3X1L0_DINQU|nr:PREDICTED: GPI ethanolamine phosphate transferase 3 [Dinoponera quadriceps]